MSTDTERQRLLTELREMGRASSAELERGEQFQRAFYPVAEHLRVFESDVNLIVGYHGAGKSMLFKAAVEQLLSASIHKRLFLPEKAVWKAGYPLGSDFPDAETLRRFVKRSLVERSLTEQANDRMLADVWLAYKLERLLSSEFDFLDAETLRRFVKRYLTEQANDRMLADVWLAYLARLLSSELKTTGEWQALLTPSSVEVDRVYAALQQQRTAVIAALDDLDARLKQEGRWIFVNYDELDTLGGIDWELMAGLIRGLLTFWAEYTRRWQRLRAKIFLRTDLFANARIFTADFTKLASNRVELTWSDRNLHAMWIKRIANRSPDWLEYCRNAGIQFERDETLGWIPYLPNAEAAQPLIERIAGPFMGSNIKKGRTFTWILDHLRDGKGRITPRTLVSLWGYAAAQELDSQKASASHLIHPTSLRRALDQVSDDYVKMLKSREMPWLEGLMKRLSNREVPLTREEWEAILATDWTQWRNDTQEKQRPPHQTPAEFLDLLLELGVCRERPDGRIDVPDLFLHGLAIKRRGGVKR